jgi:hypothetical protein
LSRAEGRRFGFAVGGAFMALAVLLWWRTRPAAPYIGGLAALLLLAATAVPDRLGPFQRAWMGLAHQISRVTTPVFMAVVYFVVLTPVGLLRRTFVRNPMDAAARSGSYWVTRADDVQSSDMKRQF